MPHYPPGVHEHYLDVGDRRRSCLIFAPPQVAADTPLPLVLVFHGGGINAVGMARFCELHAVGERAGFITVYPNGTGRVDRALSWNAGNCCGHAHRQQVDDIGFVRALLDDLPAHLAIDPHRVYATGMSNGGMMSYLVAAELSSRVAAIAAVGGPMGTLECRPERAVPLLHFHGTADEFVPYEGGRGPRSPSQTHFYSVRHGIESWVRANGCPPEPEVSELEDASGLTVTRYRYGPGENNSEVIEYRIDGGGHTWPGRAPTLDFLGATTETLSANEEIWRFFSRHPLTHAQ